MSNLVLIVSNFRRLDCPVFIPRIELLRVDGRSRLHVAEIPELLQIRLLVVRREADHQRVDGAAQTHVPHERVRGLTMKRKNKEGK